MTDGRTIDEAERPGPARLPRIAYAEAAVRAYVNELRYRRYRPCVLVAVLAYMLARKIAGTV